MSLVIGPFIGLGHWGSCGLWNGPWAWFEPMRWPKL